MEILIGTAVLAFFIKRGAVDTAALVTGRTPPSHAYRMAKLKERQAIRTIDPDPDHREGIRRVLRHWYLDACEDADEWRANRRKTRPERKAAKEKRKARRKKVIARAKDKAKDAARGAASRLGERFRSPDAAGEAGEAAPPVPEVPDNVIPIEEGRRREPKPDTPATPGGAAPGADATSGEAPKDSGGLAPAPGNQEEHQGGVPVTDTDEAGLNPHLRALEYGRGVCLTVSTGVERIRAQMEEAEVGESVTGQAGTVMDACRQAEQSLARTIQVVEEINKPVLEALAAGGYQAGEREYVENG